ncbi:SlyX family protein [Pseudomonas sp.]|jgi:SlyX protein|uniref:SlyX family protein n=1 Tax=Pseudomonas sp. TaxID=306 RepID=UPI0027298A93|nr:SlyX family protein [Pseudomonas sp.]
MTDELQQRLIDLEARLAFQDDAVQALNDMVAKQQIELDRMRRALELVARRQADLAASLPGESLEDDQPPPHY